MEELENLFILDWKGLLLSIFIIFSAIIYGYMIIGKISEILGKPFKWWSERNKDHCDLMETMKLINSLEKKHSEHMEQYNRLSKEVEELVDNIQQYIKTSDNRIKLINQTIHNFDISRQKELQDNNKAQNDLQKSQDNTNDMLSALREQLIINEEKQNKRIRAELKDKIGQAYQRHHKEGKISSMEIEMLEGLIEEYEAAGGENSFVHSIVMKEMYTWEIVSHY